MKNKLAYIVLLVFVFFSKMNSQNCIFDTINSDLRTEYVSSDQSDKLDFLNFISDNIKYHFSDNYYWVDSNGITIEYNELLYDNFSKSVVAFDSIRSIKGKLQPIQTRIGDNLLLNRDLFDDCIASSEKAVYEYNNKNIIYEYLLPYRITSEPIQNWWKPYNKRFNIFSVPGDLKKTIQNIIDNVNQWFVCTYNIERRTDPIPYLGSMQLLHRKKGGCEDAANLMTFALRSIGIPCAVDVIPYWGTSTGGHVLNTAFDSNGNAVHFDALINSENLYEMIREPSKVFRITYSNNVCTLPNILSVNDIPNYGMLRSRNYVDVTNEYWDVSDIVYSVPDTICDKIIYSSVYNGGKWKPVWYANNINSLAKFSKMVEGVLYCPMIYDIEKSKLVPVGNPKAYSNGHILSFEPSTEKISIKVDELSGYLKYRMGKVYTLYYYDKKWKMIQRKIPNTGTTRLSFNNVPKNAILLLLPEDSKGKERPFTMNEKGKRLWW